MYLSQRLDFPLYEGKKKKRSEVTDKHFHGLGIKPVCVIFFSIKSEIPDDFRRVKEPLS